MYSFPLNVPVFVAVLSISAFVGWIVVAMQRATVVRPTMFPMYVFIVWLLLATGTALFTGLSSMIFAATGLIALVGIPLRTRIQREKRAYAREQAGSIADDDRGQPSTVPEVAPVAPASAQSDVVEHTIEARWLVYASQAAMRMTLGPLCWIFAVFAGDLSSSVASYWVFTASFVLLGAAIVAWNLYLYRRIMLRPQYGLRGSDVVTRDKKTDWHSLAALGDVKEIRVECSDSIADYYIVAFKIGSDWISTGSLEHGDRWAREVLARAIELQGREVRFDI